MSSTGERSRVSFRAPSERLAPSSRPGSTSSCRRSPSSFLAANRHPPRSYCDFGRRALSDLPRWAVSCTSSRRRCRGLEADRITVVTTDGTMLHRPRKAGAGGDLRRTATVMTTTCAPRHATTRDSLEDRVKTMLEKVVGPGRADVRVTADIEFPVGPSGWRITTIRRAAMGAPQRRTVDRASQRASSRRSSTTAGGRSAGRREQSPDGCLRRGRRLRPAMQPGPCPQPSASAPGSAALPPPPLASAGEGSDPGVSHAQLRDRSRLREEVRRRPVRCAD